MVISGLGLAEYPCHSFLRASFGAIVHMYLFFCKGLVLKYN